ncbi:hypothetical protein ACSBR2_035337 [Camellia fascicularis]
MVEVITQYIAGSNQCIANIEWLNDTDTAVAIIEGHFINQFTEPWLIRPRLSGPFLSIGGREAVKLLEAEFSEAEIEVAVKSYEGNKAPGRDGFNLILFQKCWKVIKADMLQFMKEFHQNSKLVKGLLVSLALHNQHSLGAETS